MENILPQQFFTQIGEHLLSLVQELETFASSNALNDLLKLAGLGDAERYMIRMYGCMYIYIYSSDNLSLHPMVVVYMFGCLQHLHTYIYKYITNNFIIIN